VIESSKPDRKFIEISLEAISPIVFSEVRAGVMAIIKKQQARKNEYREKIPIVEDTLVVFKDTLKIGIVPRDFASQHGSERIVGKCKVVAVNEKSKEVRIIIPNRSK